MQAFGFAYRRDGTSVLIAGTEYGNVFTRDASAAAQLNLPPAADLVSLQDVVDQVSDAHRSCKDGVTPAAAISLDDGNLSADNVLDALAAAVTEQGLSFIAAQHQFVEATRGATISTGGTVSPVSTDGEYALALPPGQELRRPNGEVYRPRQLGVHTDVAVLQHLRRLPTPVNVLLSGPAGSGKTALAEVAHPDLITINSTGDHTVAQIVGQLMENSRPRRSNRRATNTAAWKFVEGPLVKAMREGRALLIDEINRLPEEVQLVLYSAADGRGYIRLDDRPDDPIVTAQPGFCLLGTLNPDSLGSTGLSEAITSRFSVIIDVDTDFTAARQLGVPEPFVKVSKNLNDFNNENPDRHPVWVPQMRELLAAKNFIDAGMGYGFAAQAMLAQCPRVEDRPQLAETLADAVGIEVPSSLRLGGQVLTAQVA